MKFRKEDRAELARDVYVALLASGGLPDDGNPSKIAEQLRLHIDRFEAALESMKRPDEVLIPEGPVSAGKRRRRSL